jgi:hypothetical protein
MLTYLIHTQQDAFTYYKENSIRVVCSVATLGSVMLGDCQMLEDSSITSSDWQEAYALRTYELSKF